MSQGSILGSLLFLIYINDLCSVCKFTTPVLFADDTNLFSSGTDLPAMANNINYELEQISLWLKVNKNYLNVKKTHYMVFTNKKSRTANLKISIDNQIIDEVCQTKFLGVIIDSKLTWKNHIFYICGKISRGIGMLIKARNYLNKAGLLSLYYSFTWSLYQVCTFVDKGVIQMIELGIQWQTWIVHKYTHPGCFIVDSRLTLLTLHTSQRTKLRFCGGNGLGVGVTKAPLVNFSVSKNFDLTKVPVTFFESHSYLTGVIAAELRQHLSNMNVIFSS